jgi:APA family basic amino acid/polyamine antiporter
MSSDLQVQASGPARLDLPRVLGAADVVGIVLGTVIGSGIFIVPATIAAQVGSPLLIMAVWVTGGVLSFLGALSFAELGAAFPQAGGVYVYLREAYGELVAFLFGWTLFFVIDSGAIATLSVAFSSKYLPYFIAMSPAATKVVALCLIAFLTTVNGLGVKWGAGLQNLLTLIKFAAIVGVSAAVFLFARGNAAHFVTPAPAGFSPGLVGAFGMALVASLWAYKGWEVATYSAGEVKHPERNLPLGLFVGTSLAIVLYVAANLAYLYVFPAGELAKSSRIAADAMNAAVGAAGASIVAFVILLSITGAANGNFLTAPRVFFAMARDGLFFKPLARVHPRFLTPLTAIVATGLWAALLSLSGTFEELVNYVIFGQWIFFGFTVAAVIVLRRRQPGRKRPYRTWGYPVTPVLFILAALYIAVGSLVQNPANAGKGLGLILLGIPAYLYWQRRRAPRVSRPGRGSVKSR